MKIILTVILCGLTAGCGDTLQGHQILPAVVYCEDKGGVSQLYTWDYGFNRGPGLYVDCLDGTFHMLKDH